MKILNWLLFLEELVGEAPISNIDRYNQQMEMSMSDKLFFIDKVDFDVIVDFGCADGKTLKAIKSTIPSAKLIGYDLDDDMLSLARGVLGKNAILTNNWNEVIKEISKYKRPLLNLSSVIHEVYSYSNNMTIKKFWNEQVFGGDFKNIAIRDMMPSIELSRNEISSFKEDIKKIRSKSDKSYLKSFENRWGGIGDYRNLIHYLLKYTYTDNWEREVNENYLPVSLETVKMKLPSNYKIVFEDSFILPYIKNQVKKDFNIELTHSTHTKLIIRNNKF